MDKRVDFSYLSTKGAEERGIDKIFNRKDKKD